MPKSTKCSGCVSFIIDVACFLIHGYYIKCSSKAFANNNNNNNNISLYEKFAALPRECIKLSINKQNDFTIKSTTQKCKSPRPKFPWNNINYSVCWKGWDTFRTAKRSVGACKSVSLCTSHGIGFRYPRTYSFLHQKKEKKRSKCVFEWQARKAGWAISSNDGFLLSKLINSCGEIIFDVIFSFTNVFVYLFIYWINLLRSNGCTWFHGTGDIFRLPRRSSFLIYFCFVRGVNNDRISRWHSFPNALHDYFSDVCMSFGLYEIWKTRSIYVCKLCGCTFFSGKSLTFSLHCLESFPYFCCSLEWNHPHMKLYSHHTSTSSEKEQFLLFYRLLES